MKGARISQWKQGHAPAFPRVILCFSDLLTTGRWRRPRRESGFTAAPYTNMSWDPQSVTYSMAQKIAEVYGVPVSSVVGPTVPIVFSMEILSMVLSIQRNRDLLEIFRLCQADPSKVEKCLSILKEDI